MWDNYLFLRDEMTEFENYIRREYPKERGVLNDLSHDVMFSGGKRIRPALTLLAAMSGKYDRSKVFPLAAAIETLHAATLVHDDIIDDADLRRGKPTVAKKHGINMAVYTGDYLLASSVLLLIRSGLPMDMSAYVAKAAKIMCIGEVNQYLSRYTVTGVHSYLRRVMKKTGVLFAASLGGGAYAAGLEDSVVKTMTRLGLNMGVAFQIRDDLLDIRSDTEREGKPVQKDLAEGIVSLPFIFGAMKDEKVRECIKSYYEGLTDFREVLRIVKDSGGIESTETLKERYILRCRDLLNRLPKTENMKAIESIVDWL
jgi:heptaprenyl diphosphate synthase